MSNVVIMLGIVGFSFLILYLFQILKDSPKQQVFRLLLFFVALGMMFLIPKVALDDRTVCENVLNSTETNEVYMYGDNYTGYHWDYVSPSPAVNDVNLFHRNINTTYTYREVCITNTSTTGETFNRAVGYYYMIVVAYMMIYLFYIAYMNFLVIFGFRENKGKDEEE